MEPKTYGEALDLGYKNGRQSYTRLYQSRKLDIKKIGLEKDRFGNLFAVMPNWGSSRYSIRQYLIKPANN